MNLNEKQQQVVNELSESILLNAPAGTGKTRVLAARVANILAQKKAKGSEILCLTFTNRACKELKNRIIDTVPEEGFACAREAFFGGDGGFDQEGRGYGRSGRGIPEGGGFRNRERRFCVFRV